MRFCQPFTAHDIGKGRELSGLTLLWTSSLSMPAIVVEMGQPETRNVGGGTEGRETSCVF